jgi:phosphate transport system permease protein
MTIQLYLSATSEGDFETAFGIAVVLLLLVFLINLGTKSLAANFDVTRKK